MERIRQAVVVTAGRRAHDPEVSGPRALQTVAGVPLVKRTILTLHRAGITRVHVVVGSGGDAIRQAVVTDRDYARVGVTVEVVGGADDQRDDGAALLAVEGTVSGPFLLVSADHVHDVGLLKAAMEVDLVAADLWLCVDRRLELAAARGGTVAVRTDAGSLIREIGGAVADPDARAVGVIVAGEALLRGLREIVVRQGDAAVTDGIRALAARSRARVLDVGAAWWRAVETAASRRQAEVELLRSLTKPTDGYIARRINRQVSRRVTGLLLDTSVTPNQMTLVANLIGYLGIWLVAGATWTHVLAGAVLVQLQSILDGCDGEIARLKFQGSRLGEWLDNVLDDTMNIFYPLALGHAASVLFDQPLYWWLGMAAAGCYVINNAVLYTQLLLLHGSGNPFLFRWWFQKEDAYLQQSLAAAGLRGRLIGVFHAMGRRDAFLFAFMVLCALRLPHVATLWYVIIAAFSGALAILHVLCGGLTRDLRGRSPGAAAVTATVLPAPGSDGRRGPPRAS